MSSTPGAPVWNKVPGGLPDRRHARRRTTPRWVVIAATAIIGGVGPVLRTYHVGGHAAVWSAVIAVTAAVLLTRRTSRINWNHVVIAAAAGAVQVVLAGELVGAWLAVGLVTAHLIVRVPPSSRTGPSVDTTPDSTIGGQRPDRSVTDIVIGLRPIAVALVIIGAITAFRAPHPIWGLVTTLLATGVMTLDPWLGPRADALVNAASRMVRNAVTHGLALVLGLVVVVAPWAINQITGADPLSPDRGIPGRWIRVRRTDLRPGQPWGEDHTSGVTAPARRRVRRRLLGFGALCIITAVTLTTAFAVTRRAALEPHPPAPPAMDAAWWDDYFFEMAAVINALQPVSGQRLGEHRGRYINVIDGVRKSWTPPPCSCRRISLWFYGGSTAFGMDQRDDYTIASQLSRLAWAEGYALDVVNRGVPGDLLWQEAQRFAWDLQEYETPDLVVFYDGANDSDLSLYLADLGLPMGTRIDPVLVRGWNELASGRTDGPLVPLSGSNSVRAETLDPDTVARETVSRYTSARELSRRLAGSSGTTARWFWQPLLADRPYNVDEPLVQRVDPQWDRRFLAAIRKRLPDGVDDLSSVLDDDPAPIFVDDAHTNERGANLVARAIFDRLHDDIDDLSR